MAETWANVRLRAQLLEQVRKAAEADQRSASNWVGVVVQKALAKAAGGGDRA
jgi:hypothetical protein